MSRIGYLWKETRHMMRRGRRYWLGPLIVILILFGLVAVFTEGAALLPLIYTLF
ncbi:MAG: DUF5989 family protein [Acidobacteriota bacterium]